MRILKTSLKEKGRREEGKKPKIPTANSFPYSALVKFELGEQIQEEGESAGFGKERNSDGEPGSRLEVAAAFLEPRSNSSRASSLPVGFGMGNQQNVLILGDWLL